MTTLCMPPKSDPAPPLQLAVVRSDGTRLARELRPGTILTVGSSPSCGLRLEDPSVSPIHCVLRLFDRELWVQDWCSSQGTLLNGQPVTEATRVEFGGEVSVGAFCIRAGVADAPAPASPCPDSSAAAETAVWPARRERVGPTACRADQPLACSPQKPAAELDAGAPRDPWPSAKHSQPSAALRFPGTHDLGDSAASFDQETLELLKAEVEQLQCELAEREQQLAEFRTAAEGLTKSPDGLGDNGEQQAALVARMESLLDELEQGDDRAAQLEEMLRCADEEVQASREEQRQLEAWVTDIEQRISHREADERAAQDQLRARLLDMETERGRLEAQLRQCLSADGRAACHARELERLQVRNTELERQFDQSEGERQQLLERLRTAENRMAEKSANAPNESALREEYVRLAHERATLARQQTELTTLRGELEHLAQPRHRDDCEVDSRVRVFREHLREIHEREQQSRSQRTLTARIAQLWHRLDGRD